jgi:hypothetical protein
VRVETLDPLFLKGLPDRRMDGIWKGTILPFSLLKNPEIGDTRGDIARTLPGLDDLFDRHQSPTKNSEL